MDLEKRRVDQVADWRFCPLLKQMGVASYMLHSRPRLEKTYIQAVLLRVNNKKVTSTLTFPADVAPRPPNNYVVKLLVLSKIAGH
jgi:hypothetical protein